MSTLHTELNRLRDRIVAARPETRHAFQPALAEMIERMEAAGEPVPAEFRNLSEDLLNDAIERQFDNMPV